MNMEQSPSILSTTSANTTITPSTSSSNQWRNKLNTLKQSFQNVGTPRFHRRPKMICK